MSRGRERSGIRPSDSLPLLTITVNGEPVTIDQRTLTMGERSAMRSALAKLDYEPDELDITVATIWVVLRRDDPTLTYSACADSITLADLMDSAQAAADPDESSPEE